jgi:guanine deaminase
MPMLRGPVLWPTGPRRVVALADGVVAPELPEPLRARREDPAPVDGLILPAFGDWHFHWVQMGIAGQARPGSGEGLLEWLRGRAWPAEERFADAARCRVSVPEALRRLQAVGTLAGAAFASPHPHAAEAFLEMAPPGFACGPAVMTAGEPAALLRPLPDVLADLARLHDRFGDRLAVSPRFALSCDEETLLALGRFAAERRLLVQTHLAETADEVEGVGNRFKARDYLEVYARAGLVTPRTLLAHAVHVSDDELARIAGAGATVVHCPTSNRALGSGRMPLERLRAAGVRWVLGSDVGAGPELSLLDVIAGALEQHEGRAPVTAGELLHRATLGRAAIASGATESEGGCGLRPGAIVVTPPDELDLRKPDADAWLGALLAAWRAGRGPVVRRVVAWSAD